MRRLVVLLFSLVIALPLALGVLAGISFLGTGEDSLPLPGIPLLDTVLRPVGYDWEEPVFGGAMYRRFVRRAPAQAEQAGLLSQPSLNVAAPEGYRGEAVVYFGGERAWSGPLAGLQDFLFLENGDYELRIECTMPETERWGHGTLVYTAALSVDVEPEIELAAGTVAQGDVAAVRLSNMPPDTEAVLECEIGKYTFAPGAQQGDLTAYVPIAHDRAPGEYTFTVRAGGWRWEMAFTVVAFAPSGISGGADVAPAPESISEEALAEREEKLGPIYRMAEPERYWRGRFETPVPGGVVSGEYGSMQVVGTATTGTRSEGMDIAAVTGTEVRAAGSGRVVFAERLLNTGNTVVVSHGGGLKSYYYHMDEMNVVSGAMVQTGQRIGTVGSTGAVGGARLHLEVRIGEEAISPSLLLNGASGVYAFE